MLNELAARCDVIEECYEFMLGFAAQGVGSEEAGQKSGMIRDQLGRASTALTGIGFAFQATVEDDSQPYQAFCKVLERDAGDTLAAIQMVLAQPSISSQLIDNLNASIHLRALLTDLFLVDEILKLRDKVSEEVR